MSNELSNVASAARFGMNPTPLGAAGLGLGIASSMLGGKGKRQQWQPKFRITDGAYQMSNNMGKTWNNVPDGYQNNPTDNAQLRANEIFKIGKPNEVRLPNGQVMNMATNQISNASVPSQDIRNPYQLQANDYRLPNGSIMNMGTGNIVNNPNVNNIGPYQREDTMIRAFGDYMKKNPASFYNSRPQQLAQGLGVAPQYQAPNITYQAPRG